MNHGDKDLTNTLLESKFARSVIQCLRVMDDCQTCNAGHARSCSTQRACTNGSAQATTLIAHSANLTSLFIFEDKNKTNQDRNPNRQQQRREPQRQFLCSKHHHSSSSTSKTTSLLFSSLLFLFVPSQHSKQQQHQQPLRRCLLSDLIHLCFHLISCWKSLSSHHPVISLFFSSMTYADNWIIVCPQQDTPKKKELSNSNNNPHSHSRNSGP